MNSPAAPKQATHPPRKPLSPFPQTVFTRPASAQGDPRIMPHQPQFSLAHSLPLFFSSGDPHFAGTPRNPSVHASRPAPATLLQEASPHPPARQATPPPPRLCAGTADGLHWCVPSTSQRPEPPLYPRHPQKANLGHPWVFDNMDGQCPSLSRGRRCEQTCWPRETLPQTFAAAPTLFPGPGLYSTCQARLPPRSAATHL